MNLKCGVILAQALTRIKKALTAERWWGPLSFKDHEVTPCRDITMCCSICSNSDA